MMDLFQIITDRIVDELEQGVIPWQKPWIGVARVALAGSASIFFTKKCKMICFQGA